MSMTRCKHGRLIEEGSDCNPYECDPKDGEEDPKPKRKFVPTNHTSGTVEKLKVMRKRYESFQPIHHPEDNPEMGTKEQHSELVTFSFTESGRKS
jgi:hypothetical protein